MRDELKNYLNADNIILNLQTTKDKGSHWILCSKKHGIYFDSYGVLPVKEVSIYFKEVDYTYNTLQVQNENTRICGQLCVFVLYKLENGEKFEDIVLDLQKFKYFIFINYKDCWGYLNNLFKSKI